ncbi:MAG: methyl-accepting chemotaxis protein [Candidatus Acidiferrales bacterium]
MRSRMETGRDKESKTWWGVRDKIRASFGFILLILVALGLVSFTQVRTIRKAADETASAVETRRLSNALRTDTYQRVAALRGYLPQGNADMLKEYQDATQDSADHMVQLEQIVDTEDERATLSKVKEHLAEYTNIVEREIELRKAGKKQEAETLAFSQEGADARDAVLQWLGELIEHEQHIAGASVAEEKDLFARVQLLVGILVLGGIASGIVTAVLITRATLRPLQDMLELIEHVANNDLTVNDLKISSRDEIGLAVEALNKMKNSLENTIQTVAANTQGVARSSDALSAVSHQMSANAEETSAQANVVSAAVARVTGSLRTVASGTEQMSISIRDIAKSATEAAKVATEAVGVAETTNVTITQLGVSSAEIGEVVKVITTIAQQTNLLALNATIEAARAGEAGKGFAVVANEVKELAKATAKATEDISGKIQAIQGDTTRAVDAIARVSAIINQIQGISSTIATAVEEQHATTNEITRNIGDAAQLSDEISTNIEGVAQAAQSTSTGAFESKRAAEQLAKMSSGLREIVERFKCNDGVSARESAGPRGPRLVEAQHVAEEIESVAVHV